METFSALLAICAGNSPVPGEFPAQRPVTPSFDVFFYLCLNKRLSKKSWAWWFEMLSRPLWRHCNVNAPPHIHACNQVWKHNPLYADFGRKNTFLYRNHWFWVLINSPFFFLARCVFSLYNIKYLLLLKAKIFVSNPRHLFSMYIILLLRLIRATFFTLTKNPGENWQMHANFFYPFSKFRVLMLNK